MPASKNREPRSPKTSHLPPKTNKTAPKRLSPPPFAPTSHLPSLLKSAEMRGNEREIDLFTLNRVRVSKSVRLTTSACRARLSTLTTEHSNQHLSVTRAPLSRRDTSAMTHATRGTKGNPVQIRCGPATVIGETLSLRHPFGEGCLRKPLSAQCGWEGGESSLSAISQEACLRVVLAALRGTSEADLPVNRARLIKTTGCPRIRPVHQVRTGLLLSSRGPVHPAPPRANHIPLHRKRGLDAMGRRCSM